MNVDKNSTTKKCPSCHEEVSVNSTKCPYCGRSLKSWFRRHPILSILLILFLLPIFFGIITPSSRENVTSQQQGNRQSEKQPAPAKEEAYIPAALVKFEGTEFCQKYSLMRGSSWDLKSGGVNHTYKTDYFDEFSLEIQTKGDRILGYGLSFYNPSPYGYLPLTEKEYLFVEDFLTTISDRDISSAMTFIKNNVEVPIKDANTSLIETAPYTWGNFYIRARKVGNQVISVDYISD